MKIVPYKSFGQLMFGISTKEDCLLLLGEPNRCKINREGLEELYYERFIVRFGASSRRLQECTLLPHAEAKIGDFKVTWDKDFLARVCYFDGSPKNIYGFIVLPSLGIAVTGIHDNDASQLAITVFSRGDFDSLLAKASPFEMPPL